MPRSKIHREAVPARGHALRPLRSITIADAPARELGGVCLQPIHGANHGALGGLSADGSFQIRQTFLNRPAPNRFDDIGRWRIESDTNRWGISVRELGDVPDAPGRSLGLGFG
jgi:hypothetical protein